MLILTRRPEESILIGEDVVITVLGFGDRGVRLGITAPRDIRVDREEIRLRRLRNPAPIPPGCPA
jgi:carbon storage regulator